MTSNGASLDQPLYGATPGQAIARFFKKYATFSGRASRSEYWWVFLFSFLYFTVLFILGAVLGTVTRGASTPSNEFGPGFVPIAIILIISGIAVIIPGIAVTVRRLHDANLSGWLYLLTFIPSVGSIILIVMAALPSSELGARFDKTS